ncbi:MAG: FAD/NAD(P)-binding protein [Gammaproteobacteria bacterium]
MKRYSVTLIGMGPRGLSVFERLAAHARASLCPIDLILIEPGPCGPGVHAARQPQHLVMDTPAGQVTVFPVAGTLDPAPACVTPTLAEWARAQGLRRYGAEVHRAGEGGAAIGDDDYLPRQLLGRYLAWAYGAIAASLPPTVRLEHLRHRAVDMVRQPDGGFVVELDSGFCVASDFVFLATGPSCRQLTDEEAQLRKFAQDHSRCNSRLRYLRHVYPLEQLGAISQQAEVAIGGMGAVAHDVLAELTVGRGGRFEQVGEQLRYVASSQEPRMTLFSRTGLAPCARACATPAPVTFHFFTAEALRDLRARARRERGDSQLDFERQLLPLLLQDMAYAFRCNQDGQAPDPVWYRPGVEERRAIDALLFPLRGKAFAGAPEGAGEFSAFAERLLRDDIAQAQQAAATGILSPLQAAASLLRAAAPLLRECVEHGGLQSASHRAFLDVFGPALARAGAGAPSASGSSWPR